MRDKNVMALTLIEDLSKPLLTKRLQAFEVWDGQCSELHGFQDKISIKFDIY
ncbi:MAG: hypothetical protein JKY90_04000 [Gammaproteobacteria bacterium]|nr:hypothetical protein [Gammaproteobacteria bacterium]